MYSSITKNKKKTTKLQRKKQYERNKTRVLFREQNESNKEIEQNQRKRKREKLIEEDIDLGRLFALASSDTNYITRPNLHETKSKILLDFKGEFELSASIVIGPVERKTNIRFRNMDDFESYINPIDIDYDSEDVLITGYVYN